VTFDDVVRFKDRQLSKDVQLCFLPPVSDSEYAIPEPFLFDSSGRAVDFRSSSHSTCTGNLGSFLAGLDTGEHTIQSSLEGMGSFIQPLSSNPCLQSAIPMSDADYHLFVTWATWTGKAVYRQRVREWIQGAQSNRQLRIAVYVVNMDLVRCD
jgi:hypothetical protein